MKYNRETVNNIKTYLINSLNFMKRIYEGIETPEQYESFHNMCENIINYCNFWANKLKPRFLFIKNEKYKLYTAFSEAASYVVNELNYMIEAYIGAESHISEQIQKQSEIEERIRIERSVHELINKEQENLEKKKSKPIGFIRYASKKRTKKKVNKTKDTND